MGGDGSRADLTGEGGVARGGGTGRDRLGRAEMADGDGRAGAPDDAHAGESAPLKVIDVTRHRNDRCDLLEPPDHVRIPDVAGVENGRYAGKMLDERRIEEPMRIGNHADTSEALWFHGAATG